MFHMEHIVLLHYKNTIYSIDVEKFQKTSLDDLFEYILQAIILRL